MSQKPRVLMIGLDAAEWTLVTRLCDEGTLPTLARLRSEGSSGTLQADATLLSGAVWPTFSTATRAPRHGVYHHKLWDPARMRFEPFSPDRFRLEPFWEQLDEAGRATVIVDPPLAVGTRALEHGTCLFGWGSHDNNVRRCWPRQLWGELESEFGGTVMPLEPEIRQTAATLDRIRRECLETTAQSLQIARRLLSSRSWDLALIVFGAPHRAGHYLWDLSQMHPPAPDDSTRGRLESAVVDVYRACDAAAGQLIDEFGDEGFVVAFAVHGMGPNPGWADLAPDILARIREVEEGRGARRGILYRLKQQVPNDVFRRLARALPKRLYDRLLSVYWKSAEDWSSTPYFPFFMDLAGYIRINLKGREALGVVEPGEDYDRCCRMLADAFASFVDVQTGRPIVRGVHFPQRGDVGDGARLDLLPDLILEWSDVSANSCREIESPGYGRLEWDPSGFLPSGRPGNHRSLGWFMATGPGVATGTVEERHIVDLAPTILNWMGTPMTDVDGRPIEPLA